MSKAVHDDVLDAALNTVKNGGVYLCVCSAQPTTYTQAITTYKLALKAITTSGYTGPADAAGGGRQLTVGAQTAITIDTSGTASHVAIADTAATRTDYVTTCTSQDLVAAGTVDIPAWIITIGDPT